MKSTHLELLDLLDANLDDHGWDVEDVSAAALAAAHAYVEAHADDIRAAVPAFTAGSEIEIRRFACALESTRTNAAIMARVGRPQDAGADLLAAVMAGAEAATVGA